MAKKLLQSGANPNNRTADEAQQTALHIAIAAGQSEIIRLFIDFKKQCQKSDRKIHWVEPDFAVSDSGGETALGFALWSGELGVAQEMIAGGVDVNSPNAEGLSLLHRFANNF